MDTISFQALRVYVCLCDESTAYNAFVFSFYHAFMRGLRQRLND